MTSSLLQSLVKRLSTGQVHIFSQLAAELDVQEPLLEQMLQDLERGGYLRSAQVLCDGGCRGCAQEGLCRIAHGGRMWVLTKKGLRLAGVNPVVANGEGEGES